MILAKLFRYQVQYLPRWLLHESFHVEKKCFKYYTKFECRRNVVCDYRYLRCPVSPATPLSVTVLFNSMFLDCPLTIFLKLVEMLNFFSAIGYKLSLNINWFATNINKKKSCIVWKPNGLPLLKLILIFVMNFWCDDQLLSCSKQQCVKSGYFILL